MTQKAPTLPPGWTSLPLGQLGIWIGGGTPSKAEHAFWQNGTIPWVSPKDMKSDVLLDAEDHITPAALEASATQLAPASSVLVVTRSGILRHTLPVALNAVPVALNQDLKAVVPHPGVDARYVAWAMRRFSEEILQECTKAGTTVQSVETSKLHRFTIPVPPTLEQRRIVSALEQHLLDIEKATAELKRVHANGIRLKQAVVDTYVTPVDDSSTDAATRRTWRRTRLGEISDAVQYGYTASATRGGGPRFLRITDIQDGNVDWSAVPTCQIAPTDIPRYRLADGDLVVARTGATTGKSYLIRNPPEAVFASYLIRLRLKASVDPAFVSLFFQSSAYWRQIERDKRGVGQPNVNGSVLSEMALWIPSLSEQQRIVAEVDERLRIASRVIDDIGVSLARATMLRKAVLHRAFDGHLVRQVSTDEPVELLADRLKMLAGREATTRTARGRGQAKMKNNHSRRSGARPSLATVLAEAKAPITPEALFQSAGFSADSVDDFFLELRREVDAGRIRELRPDSSIVLLQATNSET